MTRAMRQKQRRKADFDRSRAIIAKGSKSVALAARLFPAPVRVHVYHLYAWCRFCDDQIDGQALGFGQVAPGTAEQRLRLARMRAETEAAMAGKPMPDPVMRAFQRTFLACGIAPRYPLDLLEGFAMDVDGRVFIELNDTLEYCYHVAGTVGAMMATVMNVRDPAVLARAIDLGIAFQLTNISRDVLEDAKQQRLYLPRSWLREVGIDTTEALFDRPRALSRVVGRLLAEAERYYRSADVGIACLPPRSAWAIAAAKGVYREIGHQVMACNAQAWEKRVVIGLPRKFTLLCLGLAQAVAAKLGNRSTGLPSRGNLWSPPG